MNDLLTNADVTRERVKLRSVSCVKRKTLHPGLKAINLVTDESEEKKSWAFFLNTLMVIIDYACIYMSLSMTKSAKE